RILRGLVDGFGHVFSVKRKEGDESLSWQICHGKSAQASTLMLGDTGQSEAGGIKKCPNCFCFNPQRCQESSDGMEDYTQPIIDYVRIHQAWAPPIVFALCF